MGLSAILAGQLVPMLLCLAALYLVRQITLYLALRQFRGPPWTGFSDWPHSAAMLQNRCHEWYADANQKYGPIARVAPTVLVTSSPDVWIHVNTKPGYKRSDWYYNACRIEHRRDNVFSQTDVAKHDQRRKQMAPGYSGRENLDLEASIDSRLGEFLALIRRSYLSPDHVVPMDLGQKVQFFTLDVISTVGLGKPFGMLRRDADVDDYLRSSEQGLQIANAALAMGFSWLAHTPFLGRFIAPSARDRNGFGKMMSTCFRYVDDRTANPTRERSDMLASFIRHGLSGDDLRSEALEQVIAGSDTTSSAIRAALLHIMTNPRVYTSLQKEVDGAAQDGGEGLGIIPHAQVKQLPYLQAVIREALRIWPPTVNIFSRDVPSGGDTVVVDGESVYLPGGVSIGYSAYGIHHSEQVYGSDAKAFRPERWLISNPEKLAAMTRTNELIFGHGKYQCLGKPVAQIEIGKTIFELMRNFDLAIINPTKPWNARNSLGLFTISDMWVHVTDRTA